MGLPDKRMTEEEVVADLEDGMTIGIGGWGSRRKPMSIVRAIVRSPLRDLTVVSYGGPDIGLLCATGKVRKAIYGFVSLDTIPLDPHLRVARQTGAIEVDELDEGVLLLGLQAAAWRVPFLPTRAGLGTDMLDLMPHIRTVQSPYPRPDGRPGEVLVAAPAIELDAALVHMNRADQAGNAQFLGADPYMDDWMVLAAERSYVSCEKVVPTESLLSAGPLASLKISRLHVSGVVEAPNGAHFTECLPDYPRDEAFQADYARTTDPEAWEAFKARYLDVADEAEYQSRIAQDAPGTQQGLR